MRLSSARIFLRLSALLIACLLPCGFQGSAAAQAITLQGTPAPMPTTFPTTAVGQTSAPVTLPLTIGVDGTAITGINIPASQGGRQEYAVTSTGCALNTPLASGTVCNVQVTFSPAYPGARPVPLEASLADGSQYNFGLQGSGVGPQAALAPGFIFSLAGNGQDGYSGDGGQATAAAIDLPTAIALDNAGTIYIINPNDNTIRRVSAGIIQTIPINIPNSQAPLNQASGIALDASTDIYISEISNCFVRKVDANTGNVFGIVGSGYVPPRSGPPCGYLGDGGPAYSAEVNNPQGIAFDLHGNLYIADTANHVIRKVTAATGIITTIAGNHKPGYSGDSGPATNAELNYPAGVGVDDGGNLYIADTLNHVIREVAAATGLITTVAGNHSFGFSGDGGPATSAQLWDPADVVVDPAGNLYIADQNNSRIRMVNASTGIISTIAGNGKPAYGGDGGLATQASLQYPIGLALDSTGNLAIADSFNNRIRLLNVSQSALSFAPTPIGLTSTNSPQTATLTNTGNAPLDFSIPASGLNPAVTTNFFMTPSSTCPQLAINSTSAALLAGAACTLAIDFTPTVAGLNTGTATIADNSTPAAQVIQFNGTALPSGAGLPDFTLTASPAFISVVPPATAKYTITVAGTNGFTDPVTLAATGTLPAGATMSLSPTTVNGSGASTLTITVPASYAHLQSLHGNGRRSPIQYGMLLLPFSLLVLVRRRRAVHRVLLVCCIGLTGIAVSGLTGCANVGLSGAGSTSAITITATSQYVQHSTTVQLTVNGYTEIKYH